MIDFVVSKYNYLDLRGPYHDRVFTGMTGQKQPR